MFLCKKLKIACIVMRLFILRVPEQIKNYILRKLSHMRKLFQQIRFQFLCNHSSECLYLLKWVWTSFFGRGGEHLTVITILKTGETKAWKDEATCPRSPKNSAAEPESEATSLKIQSWFLGHTVLQEAVWFPVSSNKVLCQAEKHPQASLANVQTSAPTKDLVKPAVGFPVPVYQMEIHRPACLPFG